TQCETVEEFALQYAELMNAARSLPLLAGFCYTQFTDTYQEANGLLYADRTPKFPVEEVAMATRGAQTLRDRQIEWTWRQHLMNSPPLPPCCKRGGKRARRSSGISATTAGPMT